MNEGDLWSLIRRVLEQGSAIQQDYAAGKYESYEHYSSRVDEAARERIPEFMALDSAESRLAEMQKQRQDGDK